MLRALSLGSSLTSTVCRAQRRCSRFYTSRSFSPLPLLPDVADRPRRANATEHHKTQPAPANARPANRGPRPVPEPVHRTSRRPPGLEALVLEQTTYAQSSTRRRLPLSVLEDLSLSFPQRPPLIDTNTENGLHLDGEPRGRWQREDRPLEEKYRKYLKVLAQTQVPEDAWSAYTRLQALPPLGGHTDAGGPRIPFQYLHRLCRLLSRSLPKNRVLFLRMLSVMYYIQRCGGALQLFEWNTLIDLTGKHMRKPTPQDFKLAVDIYSDMVSGKPPGYTFSPTEYPPLPGRDRVVEPDVVTYTTLLNLATKTLHGPALQTANHLLRSSGIPHNHVTMLSLLSFYSTTKSLPGVRQVLERMQRENLDLGLPGVNASLWAYGHNNRLDIVKKIYTILRQAISPDLSRYEVTAITHDLATYECIIIPDGMRPDEITFTAMVQCMAYNGDFESAVAAFTDMLTTDNREFGARMAKDEDGVWRPARYAATYAVYRAMFLGFARHCQLSGSDSLAGRLVRQSSPWSLTNLTEVYSTFMGEDLVPSKSMIYWIMVAFNNASGQDLELMCRTWTELCVRFQGPWGGANNRLQRLHEALTLDDESEARRFLHTLTLARNNDKGWSEGGWR